MVAPLLSLVLGDGATLVVQCVPKPLLDFSRGVVRERFGDAVLAKPVYTFNLERSSKVSEGQVRKLEHAMRSRAVVVTHPTALKSLVLKVRKTAG